MSPLLSIFTTAITLGAIGCSSSFGSPPLTPDEEEPARPIAMAVDPGSLRPMAEQHRDRLRDLIDLAEQRELHEGGPRLLKTAKAASRSLDEIEARIEEATRMGSSERELDEIQQDLRQFATRLERLARALQ